MGTIFSLRSRRRQDTYLSLEVAGADLKLIHAAANGTDVVRIPASLNDGLWHQVAVRYDTETTVLHVHIGSIPAGKIHTSAGF